MSNSDLIRKYFSAGGLAWSLPASRTRMGTTIFVRRFFRLPVTNRDTSGALEIRRLSHSAKEYT
jgi:hypothetical protein